jgi:hypothetical protein
MSDHWLALNPQFHLLLGRFYFVWSIAELETSLLLGKMLSMTNDETHAVTTKMPFNVKANLIRALLKQRKPDNAKAILTALNKIQNNSKRNVFAHSIMMSTNDTVVFIDRSMQNGLTSDITEFTLPSFLKHVDDFVLAVQKFGKAHGMSQDEIHAFASAAHSLAIKSNKSPVPPSSKA